MRCNKWSLMWHNEYEFPHNIFILMVCYVIYNLIIWPNILVFITINWTLKLDFNWVLCQFCFMVINNFNNTYPELLDVLLGWQNKYVANNIICINNRHIVCITILSLEITFILAQVFILMHIFVILILSWNQFRFIRVIKTWQNLSIPVWKWFDKGLRPPPHKKGQDGGCIPWFTCHIKV